MSKRKNETREDESSNSKEMKITDDNKGTSSKIGQFLMDVKF
jgi:hypothetical protein